MCLIWRGFESGQNMGCRHCCTFWSFLLPLPCVHRGVHAILLFVSKSNFSMILIRVCLIAVSRQSISTSAISWSRFFKTSCYFSSQSLSHPRVYCMRYLFNIVDFSDFITTSAKLLSFPGGTHPRRLFSWLQTLSSLFFQISNHARDGCYKWDAFSHFQ